METEKSWNYLDFLYPSIQWDAVHIISVIDLSAGVYTAISDDCADLSTDLIH